MLVPEPQPQPDPSAPFFAPPPSPALSPLELETATRHVVNGWLDLVTSVKAPTWRQIVFGGRPIHFTMPTPPEASLEALDRDHRAMPGDGPAARAKELLDMIQKARPRGSQLRSMNGSRSMPPARDAMGSWLRRVFLICGGPAALRLLAASGQLSGRDVTVVEAAYPLGLEQERKDSVEAATAFNAAAIRNGTGDVELPMWLNDQFLTLMDEQQGAAAFQSLYSPDKSDDAANPKPPAQGPSASAPENSITKNAAPGVGGNP